MFAWLMNRPVNLSGLFSSLPMVDLGSLAVQRSIKVAEAGIELPQDSSQNTGVSEKSGAESGAVGARMASSDPDLLAVIEAWPDLPPVVKGSIVEMVRAQKG